MCCSVERKVAWLPKLEDLYRSDSQEPLPGDHLVTRMMTMTGPRPGTVPASTGRRAHWKTLQQHMQSRAVVRALGKPSGASSYRSLREDQESTSATQPCGEVAGGAVSVRTHAPAPTSAVVPWEDLQLITRRGLHHDVLHERFQLLNRRITRRQEAEHESGKQGPCVKQSPRLAAVGAVVVAMSDSLHGGERVKVPTDEELLAKTPVESLRVLRECELRTLSLLTGVKQTWRDRVKYVLPVRTY